MSVETKSVASEMQSLVAAMLGDELAVRLVFWDGSALGDEDAKATVTFNSAEALRHILWAPGELGLSRAYVAGEIAFSGDIYYALTNLTGVEVNPGRVGTRTAVNALRSAHRYGALLHRPTVPPEEVVPRGRVHSKQRDKQAIAHHYDVGNEFYSLILGASMTYSCARFVENGMSLKEAQFQKYDLVCRKLGLKAGMRLLDVGCGWGGMILHAAQHYGVNAVGITLSEQQAARARERVEEAGLSDRIEVRIQDYRDLNHERFDAVSSIGMFEHVGHAQMREYFSTLYAVLNPGGRLLNHAISKPHGSVMASNGFIARYVFPDGELQDVTTSGAAMQEAGFELRDVESLREHYALTLRCWVANLESNWDRAVELVGPNRARIWWIYMVGSAVSFETNRISIHQSLGVKVQPDGSSGMPRTRQSYA